jgi:hypothetical protein
LLSGSVSAYRLQLSQSGLEESSHYARDLLLSHISQAGYRSEPWSARQTLPALTSESVENVSRRGDQLGVQRWSNKNCYGNENPVRDIDNKPAFYLLQTRFSINSKYNLAVLCRYGADASQLRTQINNFALVEGVDYMQVLYGEDTDADHVVNHWVKAQAWQKEGDIRAIKIALLFSTAYPFQPPAERQFTMLDETFTANSDGHLRKLALVTSAIRGRLK